MQLTEPVDVTPAAVPGVLDAEALRHLLDVEMARSRRYDNPFAVVRLTARGPAGGMPSAAVLRRVAGGLRMHTRWADSVGRERDAVFLLILRETTRDGAAAVAAKLLEWLEADLASEGLRAQLAVAVSAWSKGDDVERLLARLR